MVYGSTAAPRAFTGLDPTGTPLTKNATVPEIVCPGNDAGLTFAISVTTSLYCPDAAETRVPVGASTDTLKLHCADLPPESVTVPVTSVGPIGNIVPDAGFVTMESGGSGQLSAAVGNAKVTCFELEPIGAIDVISAGQVIVGAGLTTTADAVEKLLVISGSGAAALIVAALTSGVPPGVAHESAATSVMVR